MPLHSRLWRILRTLVRDAGAMATVEFAMLAIPMILIFIAGGEMAQAIITSRNVESLSSTLINLSSQQTTCLYSTCKPSTYAPADTISTTTLQNIMAASSAVMQGVPLNYANGTSDLQMVLTEVDIVNDPTTGICCDFTVRWSYQQGGGTLRGGTNCNADKLTPVNPSAVPPAPGNISSTIMPVPPAVNASTLKLVNPEAVLIADVSYTYQPIVPTTLVSFAPAMASTRYMFPRLMGSVVLLPTGTTTVPSTFTTSNGTGQICY